MNLAEGFTGDAETGFDFAFESPSQHGRRTAGLRRPLQLALTIPAVYSFCGSTLTLLV
jgi:hypothetical protein